MSTVVDWISMSGTTGAPTLMMWSAETGIGHNLENIKCLLEEQIK